MARMSPDPILNVKPLGFPFETADPFLFCVHHDDRYPAGNERLGPATSLSGRDIGQDFGGKDGFSMYHGDVVPGFPQHPHRGFETVTVVRRGLIDHSDSMGATARFGQGDVQWLTAGQGIVHAEMFPLLDKKAPNPLELFQIWLNLPAADKFVAPHFSMLWNAQIPRHVHHDSGGHAVEITVIAGHLGAVRAPAPPPKSWAARTQNEVAIWTLKLSAGATFTLPPAFPGINRTLYVFRGRNIKIDKRVVANRYSIAVRAEASVTLENGVEASEMLMLQGRPIGEPVVQHGPFVMNTHAQIEQAFADYRRTQFGGWPWPSHGPVHPVDKKRFARHADGRVEWAG